MLGSARREPGSRRGWARGTRCSLPRSPAPPVLTPATSAPARAAAVNLSTKILAATSARSQHLLPPARRQQLSQHRRLPAHRAPKEDEALPAPASPLTPPAEPRGTPGSPAGIPPTAACPTPRRTRGHRSEVRARLAAQPGLCGVGTSRDPRGCSQYSPGSLSSWPREHTALPGWNPARGGSEQAGSH